jgi:hypothetical protein
MSSGRCLSVGRHQDFGIVGPVQDSSGAVARTVPGEDALYVEMMCKGPPFAGNNARQIGFGNYPELSLIGGVPLVIGPRERRQLTCAHDRRIAWSPKVDQAPFFVRDNLTQRAAENLEPARVRISLWRASVNHLSSCLAPTARSKRRASALASQAREQYVHTASVSPGSPLLYEHAPSKCICFGPIKRRYTTLIGKCMPRVARRCSGLTVSVNPMSLASTRLSS